MSNSSAHHQEADRLLERARMETSGASRGLILAEAQVHALLALAVATGTSPAATPPDPPDDPRIVISIADKDD